MADNEQNQSYNAVSLAADSTLFYYIILYSECLYLIKSWHHTIKVRSVITKVVLSFQTLSNGFSYN